jgi:secreted trypsin-like serine protease
MWALFSLVVVLQLTIGCCKVATPYVFIGETVTPGRLPWVVSLYIEKEGGFGASVCGGVLVHESLVLTAAHCLKSAVYATAYLHVLEDSSQLWGGSPAHVVIGGVIHPHYNPTTLENDIGVLRLATPVRATIVPPTIELDATQWRSFEEGTPFVSAGHGLTEDGGLSYTLRQVTLPKVARNTCLKHWLPSVLHDDYCAGPTAGCVAVLCPDTCRGDSGGPLFRNNTVYGLVSRGAWPCGKGEKPGIYTAISEHANFVRKYVPTYEGAHTETVPSWSTEILPANTTGTVRLPATSSSKALGMCSFLYVVCSILL